MISGSRIQKLTVVLIAFGLFSSLPLVLGSSTLAKGTLLSLQGPNSSTIGSYSCSASSPCPMGIADYGSANGKAYTYTTTEFVSWANFTSLKIGSSGKGSMTIQQNLVDYEVAVQHNLGEYWIQNVPIVAQSGSSYKISIENNIWNFSAVFKTFVGTLKSTDLKGNLLGKCSQSGVYGTNEYYACEAKTTATVKAPFEIKMMTSTSKITSGAENGDSSATFSAFIYQAGKLIAGGSYDQVAFTSGVSSSPSFHVGGKDPGGFYNDAETVLGGPGGGASVSLPTISATFSEFYLTKGALTTIPHAWSAGSDTAETASGVHMTASSKEGVASEGADNNVQLW
jgi:Thermopsin